MSLSTLNYTAKTTTTLSLSPWWRLEHSVETSAKLFSELKLVTDNLLSIYAAANWEATEKLQHIDNPQNICEGLIKCMRAP